MHKLFWFGRVPDPTLLGGVRILRGCKKISVKLNRFGKKLIRKAKVAWILICIYIHIMELWQRIVAWHNLDLAGLDKACNPSSTFILQVAGRAWHLYVSGKLWSQKWYISEWPLQHARFYPDVFLTRVKKSSTVMDVVLSKNWKTTNSVAENIISD